MKKYENTKWAERLNYLAEIEDGWYWHGEGKAIKPEVLNKTNEILETLDSPEFHLPGLFPLLNDAEDGGIGIEWAARNSPHQVSLEISNSFAYEVYVLDVEAKDDLSVETESFEEAFEFLRFHLVRIGFAV